MTSPRWAARWGRSSSRKSSALGGLMGIGKIDVKIVWSPPWSPAMMSEDARDELGIW
ncbi:MAG: hypothetical protein M9890_09925 [Thermomicrobiales bacterium]|nr:hypothetical protein [Thermomicrobiales bacterium]